MKLVELKGFDKDSLIGYDYLTEEIVETIDKEDKFDFLKEKFVLVGKKIQKNEDKFFEDFYKKVACSVATELQKNQNIMEAVVKGKTLYNYLIHNTDFVNEKLSLSDVLYEALCGALYNLIIHKSVGEYLCIELAKVLYEGEDFPYEKIKKFCEGHITTEDSVNKFVRIVKNS